MYRTAKAALLVAGLALVVAVPVAGSDIELRMVEWTTQGSMVEFHLQFQNPSPDQMSSQANGEVHSQPFGAYVPNYGDIGTFDIPPLSPLSFFDVFYEVSLSDLPPSAEIILPQNPAPGPFTSLAQAGSCPPNTFWAGNVDVFWNGPGGPGQVNSHMGTIQICPGGGPSYIHVIMDCQDPAGVTWSFSGVCPGWTASLVVDNGGVPGGPAPNPIPAGFFDGWVCVSADASVSPGDTCHFDLDLSCGAAPATINFWAEACDWSPPVPAETTTWGSIKALAGY